VLFIRTSAAHKPPVIERAATMKLTRISIIRSRSGILYVGRALVGGLFVFAGVLKIVGPAPFIEHMKAFRVPTFLLPMVAILEVACGLFILAALSGV
jgi:uncharacterized membrane protein YphA (DoxX/SURF4 family)